MPKRGSMWRLPPPNSSSGSSRTSACMTRLPPGSGAPGAGAVVCVRLGGRVFVRTVEQQHQVLGVDADGGQLRGDRVLFTQSALLQLIAIGSWRRSPPLIVDPS